jgi:Zyg-11 family protein
MVTAIYLFLCFVLFCFGSSRKFKLTLQLQQNGLLILHSDRILEDVEFDKYRCARLVMNCLCAFDDPCMNEMGVFIFRTLGKLAAKTLDKR